MPETQLGPSQCMQEVLQGLANKYWEAGYKWTVWNPEGIFRNLKNGVYIIDAHETGLRFISSLARFRFRNHTPTDQVLHYHVPEGYCGDHKKVMGKMQTENAGQLITDVRSVLQPNDCKEGIACAIVPGRWDPKEISDFIDVHITEQTSRE